MAVEETKVEKKSFKQRRKEASKRGVGLWKEFSAFINRGNVVDMAVGVIIGGAFSAIVTAVVNILLSLCTWGVPGGLKGLVTVLPAVNVAQAGVTGIGQKFEAGSIVDSTIAYAASQGIAINKDSAAYVQFQNALLSKYTLHGTTYYFNGSALIDWGTFINAVISFLIIAIVLFTVIKVVAKVKKSNEELKAKQLEDYYTRHPEDRPAPVVPGVPAPTEMDVLVQIRDELKKQNEAAAKK